MAERERISQSHGLKAKILGGFRVPQSVGDPAPLAKNAGSPPHGGMTCGGFRNLRSFAIDQARLQWPRAPSSGGHNQSNSDTPMPTVVCL